MIALRVLLSIAVAVTALSLASPAASIPGEHNLAKRSLFDASCAGVYDRQLLGKLSRVCDDCYNVYREPNVATECRSNCFYNLVFLQCLDYLIPANLHEEHMAAVQMVGK